MPAGYSISDLINLTWTWVEAALEANLFEAAIGSFAGALGGAWAAQRIADRGKYRDELQREIRDTNAATTIAYGIANAHIALKKQHIKMLYDGFREEAKRFEQFLAAKDAGTVPPQQAFTFDANLNTIQPVRSPVDQLERIVFDRVSVSSALLFTVQTLISTIQSLNKIIEERNRVVIEWRQSSKNLNPFTYFGIQIDNVVDQRYKDFVAGINSQTDDAIAFSILAADKLYEHAKNKREILRKKFRVPGPQISRVEFSESQDFLPPAENYKNFTRMFEIDDHSKIQSTETRAFGAGRR